MDARSIAEQVKEYASRHGVHSAIEVAMLAAAMAVDPAPITVPAEVRTSRGSYQVMQRVDRDVMECFRNYHSPMDWCACTSGCDLCEGE